MPNKCDVQWINIECSLFKSPHTYLHACTKKILNMEGGVCKTTNSWPRVMLSKKITLLSMEFAEPAKSSERHTLVAIICVVMDNFPRADKLRKDLVESKQPTQTYKHSSFLSFHNCFNMHATATAGTNNFYCYHTFYVANKYNVCPRNTTRATPPQMKAALQFCGLHQTLCIFT